MNKITIERVRVWTVKNETADGAQIISRAFTLGIKIDGRWMPVAQAHRKGWACFEKYSKCIFKSILQADKMRDAFAREFNCSVQEVDGMDSERDAARLATEERKKAQAQAQAQAQDAEQKRKNELDERAEALLANPETRTAVAVLVASGADFSTIARAMGMFRKMGAQK